MKYKAIAFVEGEIKPRQVFGDVYGVVSDWASKTLAQSPVGTRVDVYEVKEELVRTFTKKEEGFMHVAETKPE